LGKCARAIIHLWCGAVDVPLTQESDGLVPMPTDRYTTVKAAAPISQPDGCMPHITIEYSANLETDIVPRRLVDAIHRTALDTGVFPIGGLRTRAERRDLYAVADGDPDNAFVAIIARIGEGRDADTRKRVAAALMATLEAETATAFARRGLGLTVEVQEIDGTASLKTNNLHERMSRKTV
jgi:5-carboxymethyl-2-hydroxymuconate isomerase